MNSIWKNRDFVWLVSGQTLSQFGAAINNFAIPWLLLQLTGSAMQMGFVFAIGFVPYLLLSLPAGVWADRYNRKNIMMAADLGRLLLLVSLPVANYFGAISIIQLYIIQVGMSSCSALFDSAYGACVPSLVKKEQLKQANSVIQFGMSTSQVLGPALGGMVVGLIGAPYTLIITACTYFISVLSLTQIKSELKVLSGNKQMSGMFTEIKEGLAYVWNHRLIRITGLFGTATNFVIFATNVALYYRIQHEMMLSSRMAGMIMAFWSGGQVLGSFINGYLGKKYPLPALLKLLLVGQLIPPFIIAFSYNPFIIATAYTWAGICLSCWNIQIISLRQAVIPDYIIGRATTSIRLVSWASIPIGNSAGGMAAQFFGTSMVFAVEGMIRIGMLVAGIPLFSHELQSNKTKEISA